MTAADSGHGYERDSLVLIADSVTARGLITTFVSRLAGYSSSSKATPFLDSADKPPPAADVVTAGLAALEAFLQANVTGPVLSPERCAAVDRLFADAWISQYSPEVPTTAAPSSSNSALQLLRKACFSYLDVDGVAPYAHIPHLELFAFARYVFIDALPANTTSTVTLSSPRGPSKHSISWMRLRVHAWHYKLLTQPSLGPGSNFTRSSQWSDVPTLTSRIVEMLDVARDQLFGSEVWATVDETWGRDDKVLFLTEAASINILLGRHGKAKESLNEATQSSGLLYKLSGALGKRTKFQENSISQLIVLARSAADTGTDTITPSSDVDVDDDASAAKPDALQLNDDTLLEEIQFTESDNDAASKIDTMPAALAELSPDDQPQLNPLDQIILLAEATLKDASSPVDTLTAEEILPYAVRVLGDKSTNWQVYTQALLVRSRIEMHRSRTIERGILQLQALADQVLSDTTGRSPQQKDRDEVQEGQFSSPIPDIQVTAPGQSAGSTNGVPATSFLPAIKASESAPAHVRLQYIHALSSPPRWHLEAELAYAWAGVGSLVSALEIFRRLRLWAEVALCLASSARAEDEDGRGSGGEDKAKAIIRWRLFHRSGDAPSATDPDEEDVGDAMRLKVADFAGAERQPPPPNAARLWCILGDLESDAAHYEKAWDVSQHRFARAQKSIGEYHLQQKEWEKARTAYKKATAVNRLSPEMWGRLGDISLRLGHFEEAAEAYSRSIGSATDTAGGEGARTWSNLGSALWSLYCEMMADEKDGHGSKKTSKADNDDDDEVEVQGPAPEVSRDPSTLIAQSLAAYKKGASIAHDNWRIWDNVLTLASRVRPIPVADMILALTNIIRIRHTEDAIDAGVLAALLQDVVLPKDKDGGTGIYEPPRGSAERLVTRIIEEEVVPIITRRHELWALVSRLRAWRRDYAGAIEASERAWRAAISSSGGSGGAGLLPGETTPAMADWTVDEAAWAETVKRTDELVSVLENWGPDVDAVGPRWRSKARSAVRSVMGKAKTSWEGTDGWKTLEGLMEGLRVDA